MGGMLSAVSNPIATALSALQQVQGRVAQDANAIAGGTADDSGTDANGAMQPAAPVTGTSGSNPVPPMLQYQQGGDITANVVDLLAAKTAYKANADVLRVAAQMGNQLLNIRS